MWQDVNNSESIPKRKEQNIYNLSCKFQIDVANCLMGQNFWCKFQGWSMHVQPMN